MEALVKCVFSIQNCLGFLTFTYDFDKQLFVAKKLRIVISVLVNLAVFCNMVDLMLYSLSLLDKSDGMITAIVMVDAVFWNCMVVFNFFEKIIFCKRYVEAFNCLLEFERTMPLEQKFKQRFERFWLVVLVISGFCYMFVFLSCFVYFQTIGFLLQLIFYLFYLLTFICALQVAEILTFYRFYLHFENFQVMFPDIEVKRFCETFEKLTLNLQTFGCLFQSNRVLQLGICSFLCPFYIFYNYYQFNYHNKMFAASQLLNSFITLFWQGIIMSTMVTCFSWSTAFNQVNHGYLTYLYLLIYH